MDLNKLPNYTIEDIYNLPDGTRAELIDGELYMMAPPKRFHQKLITFFVWKIRNHIEQQQGSCEVYPAPFAVFLNADDKTYVEPDISVICDSDKLTDSGCLGAPDWVIEVVSPSSQKMDYGTKLFKYRTAGVLEYWIVDPSDKSILIYDFHEKTKESAEKYTFQDTVASHTIQGLSLCLAELTAA